MRPLHLAMILMIDVVWALNTLAIKYSVEAIPPLAAVCVRYCIVLLVCLPWLRWLPGRMGIILVTGVIAGALFFGLGGVSFAVADNVAALAVAGQLGVPFSLILAVIFLRERIRWKRIAGIALCFAGVAILGFDPSIVHERLGLVLTVAASFLWAVGSLLFRKLAGVHPLTIHGWLALVSAPLLAAASLWLEPGALATVPSLPLSTFGWLAYSAIGASIIGHAGMSWLLQRYPVTVIAPLTLPTPLLSVIVAVIAFDTPVTAGMVVGGALTMVGLAIVTLRTAAKREAAAA